MAHIQCTRGLCHHATVYTQDIWIEQIFTQIMNKNDLKEWMEKNNEL